MESLPDIPGLLGGFGALGLLAWLWVRVITHSGADRKEYREQIAERDKLISDLREKLEIERKARWKAEDDAARYRRQLGETP